MGKEYRVEKKIFYDNYVDYEKLNNVFTEVKRYYNGANTLLRFLLKYTTDMKREPDKVTKEQKEYFEYINSLLQKYNEEMVVPKGKEPLPLLTEEQWFPSEYALRWAYNNHIYQPQVKGITNTNVLIFTLLYRNWKSFFKLRKVNPKIARPPNFVREETYLPLNIKVPKTVSEGYWKLPKALGGTEIKVDPTKPYKLLQVVQQHDVFSFNFIYETDKVVAPTFEEKPATRIVGIDLGVNKFATLATNFGKKPIAINGGWLKAKNVYYNKHRRLMKERIKKYKDENNTTQMEENINQLRVLARHWSNGQYDFMHKASRAIVNFCIVHDVDTVVIGEPKLNSFVEKDWSGIGFTKIIELLEYKLREHGIRLVIVNEAGTTVQSFLDRESLELTEEGTLTEKTLCTIEEVPHETPYGTKMRKMILTLTGRLVDIDVNAAYNMIRVGFPDAEFADTPTDFEIYGLDKKLPKMYKTEYLDPKVTDRKTLSMISASMDAID